MQLRPGELQLLQQMVQQLAGVELDAGDGQLVEGRIGAVAEQHGCANFNELYFRIRYGSDARLMQQLVDAITTHETHGLRDDVPFDALQFKVLPAAVDARQQTATPGRLRIWSAACGSGQEPYSIAMILAELLPDLDSRDVQILGTDSDQTAVAAAERGIYADREVQRRTRPELLKKYFQRVTGGWQVQDAIRRHCRFQRQDLLQPFVTLGPFDVVLVRNVLPGFDAAARKDIATRLRSLLLPHGWLFVGSSDNVVDLGTGWRPETHCRTTVYRPDLPAMARH
ncbi:MAG TPA: protein-glutamate O-methyltransferase CheR [Planctomycetota bacterium]|nr:protein-glutamate O-methyltransferase CheR [Planctomycetota bacterium]